MSRIQHILDKAERDGTVQRMRVVVETPSALTSLGATPAMAPPLAPSVEPPVDEVAPLAPMRVITDAQLDPRLVAASAPASIVAEQYRALRTRILHGDTGASVNVVLITSPAARDGKSITVAN